MVIKKHFWQKFKNEAFAQKLYFSNAIPNKLLNRIRTMKKEAKLILLNII
jgi:hypothetical protein